MEKKKKTGEYLLHLDKESTRLCKKGRIRRPIAQAMVIDILKVY